MTKRCNLQITEKEQYIYEEHALRKVTFVALGKQYGVTPVRIRYIFRRAAFKLGVPGFEAPDEWRI